MKVKSMTGTPAKQRLPIVGGGTNPGQPSKLELSGMKPDPRPGVQAAEARATALTAAEQRAERTRTASNKRWAAYPLQVIGGGPWALNENCKAPRHNTGQAARGRHLGGSRKDQRVGEKCICPRALKLLEEYSERENARKRGELPRRPKGNTRGPLPATPKPEQPKPETRKYSVSIYLNNNRGVSRQPEELRNGACRTPEGMRAMDSGIESRMRLICQGCPSNAKVACLRWALENEGPAWDGMYGGLMPAERDRIRKGTAA